MLRADNLCKAFGPVRAVNRVSLEVRPGQIFVLLGPNGSGKTTTLRLISGLLRPDSGTIIIAGHDLWQEPLLARSSLGYVPEPLEVYEDLSGREFLDFVASLYRLPRGEARQAVAFLLELFDLEAAADRLAGEYSQGMKRKLLIAAALLHRPALLVMDEPFNGLDPASNKLLRDVLQAQASRGVAVLVSTHLLELAGPMASCLGIMAGGQLKACGPVESLVQEEGPDKRLEDVYLRLTGGDRYVAAKQDLLAGESNALF